MNPDERDLSDEELDREAAARYARTGARKPTGEALQRLREAARRMPARPITLDETEEVQPPGGG